MAQVIYTATPVYYRKSNDIAYSVTQNPDGTYEGCYKDDGIIKCNIYRTESLALTDVEQYKSIETNNDAVAITSFIVILLIVIGAIIWRTR